MSNDELVLKLNGLRDSIDNVDEQILALLQARALLAKQVGELKQQGSWTFHVPERERNIVERLRTKNHDSLFPGDSVGAVYREIMSACLRLESPITVSYLGPGTSFSYLALRKAFGASALAVPERSIESVYDSIENERTDYAVVPIENSFEGTVNNSMQRMLKTGAQVHGEIFLPICHNLTSRATKLSEVTKVYSHPQALGQCRIWLTEHLPQAELLETLSTAQACAEVTNKPWCAAISNIPAALENGLSVLVPNIHDRQENETRFLVLTRQAKLAKRPSDKTTVVFSVANTHGQLAKVLNVFDCHGVNLLKLESVPSRESTWGAFFWLDISGSDSLLPVAAALTEVSQHCEVFRLVGSYSRLG